VVSGGAVFKPINGHNRRLVIADEVRQIAGGVAEDARARTPRGATGRAAAGWHTVPGRDPGTTVVVNEVEYIRHLEYGTRRRPAAAMLGQALAAARGRQ
jgi:hypothetical protein